MWSWSEWSRFWIPGARSGRIPRPRWKIFPAGELDYRPTPEVATFREMARHILDASDGLIGMLLAGDENFTGADFRDRLKPHMRSCRPMPAPAELANALRESVAQRTAELAAQPPEFFDTYHYPLRRAAGDAARNGADDKGARINASLAAFHVSSPEGDHPGDDAAPDGEAGGK